MLAFSIVDTLSGEQVSRVWSDGNILYTAGPEGLGVYKLEGNQLTEVPFHDGMATEDDVEATAVWGDDNFIYVGYSSGYLMAYTYGEDDELAPAEGENPPFDGIPTAIWGDGAYIYVSIESSIQGESSGGVRAVKINENDPMTPGPFLQQIGSGMTMSPSKDVWSYEGKVFVADGDNGLAGFNFEYDSDPEIGGTFAPIENSVISGTAHAVWGNGSYLFVAQGEAGIAAYALDSGAPVLADSIDTEGTAYDVWGYESTIFVADGSNGLLSYNFDGVNFQETGHLGTDQNGMTITATTVWGNDNIIYISDTEGTLTAIQYDFINTEPAEPEAPENEGDGDGNPPAPVPTPSPTPSPAPSPDPTPVPAPSGPVIIPSSVVPVVVKEAPVLGGDGLPVATNGTAVSGAILEIQSDFSARMGENIDNLALTGKASVNGWDNSSDNVIYGNAGANTLYLWGGNDTIDGGSNFDRLALAGTSKDYDIEITNGFAVIHNKLTSETIKAAGITSISFGNSSVENGSGAVNALTTVETVTPAAETSYSSTVNSEIDGLYKAYYAREATSMEYANGVVKLQQGASLQDLASELAATPVGQQHLQAEASDTAFVESLYASVHGRTSDAEGLAYWTGELENGNLQRADVALNFALSDEYGDSYLNLFATNQSDVEGLYRSLLGRASDKEGFAYYLDESANGETFEVIAQSIAHSDEFVARIATKSATEILEELYGVVLKREADADGMAYWQDKLDEGVDIADIAIFFVTSDEFQTSTDLLLSRNDWLDLM